MANLESRHYLEGLLSRAGGDFGFDLSKAAVTVPELAHGDYTTNAALTFAKIFKKNPQALATEIAQKIRELDSAKRFAEITVAGGFINFRLSEDILKENLRQILEEGESYGRSDILKKQKIMVEYTDPNPFKEFHIGHLMSNAIGESIARIIEANGAEVKRANWQGDVGIHVAKVVWGIIDLGLEVETVTLGDLGKAYAHGASKFEVDENVKTRITEINAHIFSRDDETINHIYDAGRKISLEVFEKIYQRLGTKFDHYFFESIEGLEGRAIVEAHLADGVFEKSEGAVIFRGEKFGLHTRVFINSNGLPTYEAKELGLNKKKFEAESGLGKSIIVTGNEIKEYFRVLLAVMALIFPEIAEKTIHLPHGMLRLASGKMSSRTGDVITAESLLSEIKQKVYAKIAERGLSEAAKEEIAETVTVGALKYSILRQDIGKDIIFDFDKSLAFEGDSGPYLQYTHARACSVLKKAAHEGVKPEISGQVDTGGLERWLYRYPEVVERACSQFAPHTIVGFLLALASCFNQFYSRAKIVDAQDPKSPRKLAVTAAVAVVIKNGLHLLGIKAPEEM